MTASNTQECFRVCVGKRVTGVLFDAMPPGRHDLSSGTKTLLFDDGTGLTVACNGSFWIENPEDVKRAIEHRRRELDLVQNEMTEVLAAAGVQR